jgi:sulfonate transport system substrate-binding protein
MKILKKMSVVIAGLMIATLFNGCTSTQNSETKSKKDVPKSISISYVKAPLNVPSIVEKREKLFENEFSKDKIKITYPEITEGSKMTEAVAAGSLDFCNAIGATSVILAAANGGCL